MGKNINKVYNTLGLILMTLLLGCSQLDIQLLNRNNKDKVANEGKDNEVGQSDESKRIESLRPVVANRKSVKQTPQNSSQASEDEVTQNSIKQNQQEMAESDSERDKEESSKYPQFTREKKRELVTNYCERTQKTFDRYGWGQSSCEKFAWQFVRTSVNGDPLLWRTYGEPAENDAETETTLIMCGVHGDEITPIKFCYDVLNYMEKIANGKVIDPHTNKTATLKGKLVIVSPLVNPDSYFKKRPTRTNANGVDVNRNFPTHDFRKMAMKSWVERYRKDKRRFPGKQAMSEPETIFQVNLIYRYKPDKIISVHAPLTMLDYDGPASAHTGGIVGSRANQLLIRMSEQAKGYRIKNYPFFPGSLGNYAGNERNIPTFTLELPTSDPSKASSYWSLFKESIHSAVMHEIKGGGFVALDQEENPYEKTKQKNN